MADPLESAGKIVPDMYYDLIARIIPGGAYLSAIVFSSDDKSLLAQLDTKYGFVFIVIGGYIIGMILTGISSLVVDLLVPAALKWAWARGASAIGGASYYVNLERAVENEPQQAARTWKMAAEKVCFENGLVACALLYFFLPPTAAGMQVHEHLLIFSTGVAIAWLLRTAALYGRVMTANSKYFLDRLTNRPK
ncbi:MAG TPA: hypothetical protein PLC14_20860 [Accumulibacter sp.]|uniref:hypothetical protein n=1 Tax=unclassified Candidatus Accumulibacter TaxID=2619054 RepID=UPI0025B8CE0E|nr:MULTISPECIES: hypothetical protein [unclassified Candidatus Accumulibacter]HRE72940.1 hypothetical protein [Accumulibacter sp.]